MKIVSQLDDEGYFVAAVEADKSPMEPGVYLLPGGCIDKSPPAVVEPGKRYRVWGAGWRGEDLPSPPADATPEQLTPEQQRRREIADELAAIDEQSVRPARGLALAMAAGLPLQGFAADKLQALEEQAAALRAELAALAV